jgi:hypothetical protein
VADRVLEGGVSRGGCTGRGIYDRAGGTGECARPGIYDRAGGTGECARPGIYDRATRARDTTGRGRCVRRGI